MTARRLKAGLALGAIASLAVAGQASAATKSVNVGGSKGTAVFNDFFRHKVAIHQGDSVSFQFRGFHNVYIPKKGTKPGGLLAPDPSAKYSGLNDPTGAPFWFDGVVPLLMVNPAAVFPSATTTYDGSKAVGSGQPGGSKPFVVKFTKKGSFTIYCSIHPGMKGQVSVLPRTAKVPTQAQDAKAAKQQTAVDVKIARELDRKKVPAATVRGGSDKPPVNHLKFYPSSLTVKAGQPVTFAVDPKNQEPHSLAIGPAAYLQQVVQAQFTPVFPAGGGAPTGVFLDGRVALPSTPPATPGGPLPPFDGVSHGGFFNTGVLGAGSSKSKSVTFTITKSGTYPFICLIHPEMTGTITVK